MLDIQQAINKDVPLGLGEIPYLPDQAMHLEADIESLTHDTGWEPKTNFADGIRAMMNIVHMGDRRFLAGVTYTQWLSDWKSDVLYADCG